MKKIDYKHMSKKEMAQFLCELMEDVVAGTQYGCCEVCPVQNKCFKGHTGFLDILFDTEND